MTDLASQALWPEIARRFRFGQDTLTIATVLRLPEASVANALPHVLSALSRRASYNFGDPGPGRSALDERNAERVK